jgi:hypothetical protein
LSDSAYQNLTAIVHFVEYERSETFASKVEVGRTSPLDIVLIVNLDDITSYTLEHPVD